MDNFEQEAIRRVLAGDADTYRLLMERHLPAVLQMTRRVCGSGEDAEEAAQEAFFRAYRKLPHFAGRAAFGTWVYRIAVNCALNLIERRARDVGWHAVALDDDEGAFAHESPPGTDNPETVFLRAEEQRRVDRYLLCLTPMERCAFVLRHLEDQPIAAIAEALNLNTNTARQTVFRAVSKLRREQYGRYTGYRLTLSYARPSLSYSYGTASASLNTKIAEAAGTYVVEGPRFRAITPRPRAARVCWPLCPSATPPPATATAPPRCWVFPVNSP